MKKKGISLLTLVFLLALSFTLGGLASDGAMTVQAFLRQDSVYLLNGKEVMYQDPSGSLLYPIEYNGRVYLPSSVVQSAAGITIFWDHASGTVTFASDQGAQSGQSADPPPSPEGISFSQTITHQLTHDRHTRASGHIINQSGKPYAAITVTVSYFAQDGALFASGSTTIANLASGQTQPFETIAPADCSSATSYRVQAALA